MKGTVKATCKACGWKMESRTRQEARRHLFCHWACTGHEDLWASNAKYGLPAKARERVAELRRRGILPETQRTRMPSSLN